MTDDERDVAAAVRAAGRPPTTRSRDAIRRALVGEIHRGDARRDLDHDSELEVAITESVPHRSRNRPWIVAVAALIAVLALVGGLLSLAGRPSGDEISDDRTNPDVTEVDLPSVAEILERMPAGPLDGKQSWKLPVVASPQSDVRNGQAVTVVGRGFVPGERVGIVMCAAEAAVEGVAACELGGRSFERVTYSDASRQGDVTATFEVRRRIRTPATGPVDCRSAAERCLVAIGAVTNYDRSGGSFLRFVGAPPFPEPVLTADPAGPYVPGQAISVQATGLLFPREVELLQCRDDRCRVLRRGVVASDGSFARTVKIQPAFVDRDGEQVACEGACVVRVDGIGAEGSTSAPMPPPIPMSFTVASPTDPTHSGDTADVVGTWIVTRLEQSVDGGAQVLVPMASPLPTYRFDDDGTLSGFDGCNSHVTSWSFTNGGFTSTDSTDATAAATAILCKDSNGEQLPTVGPSPERLELIDGTITMVFEDDNAVTAHAQRLSDLSTPRALAGSSWILAVDGPDVTVHFGGDGTVEFREDATTCATGRYSYDAGVLLFDAVATSDQCPGAGLDALIQPLDVASYSDSYMADTILLVPATGGAVRVFPATAESESSADPSETSIASTDESVAGG